MRGLFCLWRATGAQQFRFTLASALCGLLLVAAAGCVGRQAPGTATAGPQSELEAAERAKSVAGTAAKQGTFTASRTCPLFQSKRDRTNPGNLQTAIGASYSIREALQGKDGAWYRVQTDAATSPLRWVSADCGSTEEHPEEGDVCHRPSHQDSHKLALSWQPAFCASHMDKTECKQATSDRYDAKHFTLHGLWPNQRTCRDEYGFCGQVHAEQRDFCDYPEVALTPQLRERLGEVMPSVAYGTCLERHEWWKHGTCWAGAPEAYFTEAMRLVRFINESAVVSEVVSAAIGKSVDASELLRAIDAAFGNGASKKFELSCNRQKELVEVRVSLPATIQPDEPLPALLERAPNANAGCTGPLRIVAYGN